MDELDEKEIQLFADAKKKMVQMRKDKEIELFRFVSRRGISFHWCVGGTGVLVVFCIIIQTHPDIRTYMMYVTCLPLYLQPYFAPPLVYYASEQNTSEENCVYRMSLCLLEIPTYLHRCIRTYVCAYIRTYFRLMTAWNVYIRIYVRIPYCVHTVHALYVCTCI